MENRQQTVYLSCQGPLNTGGLALAPSAHTNRERGRTPTNFPELVASGSRESAYEPSKNEEEIKGQDQQTARPRHREEGSQKSCQEDREKGWKEGWEEGWK
ncbi:MAG: hypothetical protein ACKVK6_13670, partial [bacterium]